MFHSWVGLPLQHSSSKNECCALTMLRFNYVNVAFLTKCLQKEMLRRFLNADGGSIVLNAGGSSIVFLMLMEVPSFLDVDGGSIVF